MKKKRLCFCLFYDNISKYKAFLMFMETMIFERIS